MHHGYDSTMATIQRMKFGGVACRCLVPMQDDYELHVPVPRRKICDLEISSNFNLDLFKV